MSTDNNEGSDSWVDVPDHAQQGNRKQRYNRREEIRRQIELGARPDLVGEAIDVFWRTQEYTIVKWIRWAWEWCVGS